MIFEQIKKITQKSDGLSPGDISTMGDLLNCLSNLKNCLEIKKDHLLSILTNSLILYLEKLVLEEREDLQPFKNGILLLAKKADNSNDNEQFPEEVHCVLKKLDCGYCDNIVAQPAQVNESLSNDNCDKESDKHLSDEDVEIIGEFVVEAFENLDTIEINLINLEQKKNDKEIINSIFRPFHTIKGVSGFLKFHKINKLSHNTENLLDNIRKENVQVDSASIDAILESVDLLKKLINNVKKALEREDTELEGDIEVDTLIKKIQKIEQNQTSDEHKLLGEILVDREIISDLDVKESLLIQKEFSDKKIGEILIDNKKITPQDVITGLRDQKNKQRTVDLQVKVDINKLDTLVDLTGELVLANSMLKQNSLITALNDKQLGQTLNQLNQIVTGLQKISMRMRMVPIKNTFQKMFRLVRDLSNSSGKQAEIKMFGEDTEIDRNVVEELYEPMVHMIRNAVDHGIETPEERQASGKNPKGTITLSAYHKSGNIVIEIADDGKGLNKERILKKAISTNIIKKNAVLSESEIFNLIFKPGFSTAQEITDISGRGVGMDVVKNNIEKLRGQFDIRSVSGQGSTVVIHLPLTLAIIEGMIVGVEKVRYIIPAMSILESFQPQKKNCYTVKNQGEMVMFRDAIIPLIRLNQVYNIKGKFINPWDGLVVVVESNNEQRGLFVNELLRKEEIVIKNLGETFKGLQGIAGGTILGDGRIGLILDVAGLFELAEPLPQAYSGKNAA